MKRGRRIALGIVAILLALVGTAYALARSSAPEVPLEGDAENEDATALRDLLHEIGDPRDLEDGQVVTLALSQRQVSALAAEASRRRQRVSARAQLRESGLEVTLSAESPKPWLTPYVNVHATLEGPPSAPRVRDASLGDLPIPSGIGQMLFDYGFREIQARDPIVSAAIGAVEDVEYGADALTVRMRWTEALRDQLRRAGREVVAQELGGERLPGYFEALRAAVADPRPDRPLGELMTPLFALARRRVTAGADAREELEAAMVALTLYSLHMPPSDVLGEGAPAPLEERAVLMHGRVDLARHFLVSAVTTLLAHRAVADALGVAKELRDSEDADGSGFSFADLAADRAGTRLMEEGTRSPARLTALIARLSRRLADSDLVPLVGDLPEGMDASAFRAAYEHVDSDAYRRLVARIDERTNGCDAHRTVRLAP
ncbi:MAG: hypothetical protein R3B82_20445 [Sandaracinaceae bacterium]